MSTTRTQVEVFDTTLRDGLQVEGVSATVEDKLRIAEQLDYLGVHFIEGGWPGANPKDIEFFARAATELHLTTSTFVAFGSTRRPLRQGRRGPDAPAPARRRTPSAVCIVAKSSDYHVTQALQTTLEEGAAMIADSVEYLRGHGRMVLVDMEHFFDGFKENPEFSFRALEAAVVQGRVARSCCATPTAARSRTRSRTSSARCTPTSATTSHRHPLPRRHRLRRRQLDGGGARRRPPRAGHASTGSASAPATPTSPRSSRTCS